MDIRICIYVTQSFLLNIYFIAISHIVIYHIYRRFPIYMTFVKYNILLVLVAFVIKYFPNLADQR